VSREILRLAGVEIMCRSDGYLPMSFLRAGGKTYKDLTRDFERKGRVSQLLEAQAAKVTIVTLGKSDDFSVHGLIEVNTKTKKHFRGFLHPRAALVIALNWFKPEIASEAADWYYRFLAGDASLVHAVADRVDLVHGTKSLLTRTVVDKQESDEMMAHAHAKAAKYQADVVTLQSQLRKVEDALAVKKGDLDNALSQLSLKTGTLDESLENIALLNTKLKKLGADSQNQSNQLTLELRKRRRLCEVITSNDVENEKILEVSLMQTGSSPDQAEGPEQPLCNSMPTRFLALRGVTEATNGKDHKIAHALIKACLADIGENLMKHRRANNPTRSQIMGCMTTVLDEQALDNTKNKLTSNVCMVNMLCANLKRVHGLQYATHLTLGALYRHVRRANRWFRDRRLSSEFQLVQESDLAIILNYEGYSMPRVMKYNASDIRMHFV
jgi:hypothetical protein